MLKNAIGSDGIFSSLKRSLSKGGLIVIFVEKTNPRSSNNQWIAYFIATKKVSYFFNEGLKI